MCFLNKRETMCACLGHLHGGRNPSEIPKAFGSSFVVGTKAGRFTDPPTAGLNECVQAKRGGGAVMRMSWVEQEEGI